MSRFARFQVDFCDCMWFSVILCRFAWFCRDLRQLRFRAFFVGFRSLLLVNLLRVFVYISCDFEWAISSRCARTFLHYTERTMCSSSWAAAAANRQRQAFRLLSCQYRIFSRLPVVGQRSTSFGSSASRYYHHACVASPTNMINIWTVSLNMIATGVWSKSSLHKAWCNTVIVLSAFSLLRYRGATARRPEPKRVLPRPNPKLGWR